MAVAAASNARPRNEKLRYDIRRSESADHASSARTSIASRGAPPHLCAGAAIPVEGVDHGA